LLPLLAAPVAAHAAVQVPLCPGLTIVTAVTQRDGDYESIKTVESVGADEVRLKYSSEYVDSGLLGTGELMQTNVQRRVLAADLASSTLYQQIFAQDADELIPGTTAIGTSAAVLEALKSQGSSNFSISVLPGDTPLRANREVRPHAYDYLSPGTIERVGTVRIPVIVNDELVELTAIHARGQINFETSEFFFLDDEQNPMTLRMRIGVGALKAMDPANAEMCRAQEELGVVIFASLCLKEPADRDTLQVIKIAHDCPVALAPAGGPGGPPASPPGAGSLALPAGSGGGGAGSGSEGGSAAGDGEGAGASGGSGAGSGGGAGATTLEQALEDTGRADVYSIYFSFDSDAIREESEPTLAEIADLLRKHPDWRLTINGHTDDVASDAYNLDLSRRRAAATVSALTSRYGIDASRLTSSGSGESSPKDTNDTLEGRARNRRVELIRLP
jgi:outer membrane protein OmpA-like peptidoglycan-associated protein